MTKHKVSTINYFQKKKINNKDETISRHFYFENTPSIPSKHTKNYIDSIIEFCSSKNINLEILTTPVAVEYFNSIPQIFINEFNKSKKMLREKGIKWLDFSNFSLEFDDFMDCDHLNSKGAKKFTEYYLNKKKQQLIKI